MRRETYTGRGSIGGWIASIGSTELRRVLRSRYRKISKSASHDLDSIPKRITSEVLANAADQNRQAQAHHLRLALHRLPIRQRQVVLLRVYDGLAFAAIGRRLAITSGTARAAFRDGVRSLDKQLSHPRRLASVHKNDYTKRSLTTPNRCRAESYLDWASVLMQESERGLTCAAPDSIDGSTTGFRWSD
jgi:RNA polymerase sigma factor (sigma-70 family)